MVIFVGLKVKKEIRKKIKFKKNIYIALRPPKIGDLQKWNKRFHQFKSLFIKSICQ